MTDAEWAVALAREAAVARFRIAPTIRRIRAGQSASAAVTQYAAGRDGTERLKAANTGSDAPRDGERPPDECVQLLPREHRVAPVEPRDAFARVT